MKGQVKWIEGERCTFAYGEVIRAFSGAPRSDVINVVLNFLQAS